MDHDDGRSDKERRQDEERRRNGKGSWGAPLPLERPVEPNELDDDEIELIGELDNDQDDSDGWLSERLQYWADLQPAEPPSRLAWLRHRLREAQDFFGIGEPLRRPWEAARTPAEEWSRLFEEAVGPEHAGAGPDDYPEKAAPPNSEAQGDATKPAAFVALKPALEADFKGRAPRATKSSAGPSRRWPRIFEAA